MKRKNLGKLLSVVLAATLTFSSFGTSSLATEDAAVGKESSASLTAEADSEGSGEEGLSEDSAVTSENDVEVPADNASGEPSTDPGEEDVVPADPASEAEDKEPADPASEADTEADAEAGASADAAEESATDIADDAASFASSEEDMAETIEMVSEDATLMGDPVTEGSCGSGVKWNYNADTKTLTINAEMYNLPMDDYSSFSETPWYGFDYEKVVIGYNVGRIGNYAFGHNDRQYGSSTNGSSTLKSVTFERSAYGYTYLRSIGNYAFSCSNITDIELPESLQTIGSYAFQATRLTSVTIPENVTSIGTSAFALSDSITEINFRTLDFELESGIFGRNGEINSVTFPEGCTSIPDRLFSGVPFEPDYEMVIPATVTSIGFQAFGSTGYNNKNQPRPLKKLSFENGSVLKEIKESAFNGVGLTTVTLPSSLESIGKQAFQSSALTGIVIPENVEFIGEYAFANCTGLTSVSLMNPNLPEAYSYTNAGGNTIKAQNQFSACPINTLTFAEGTKNIPYGLFCAVKFSMDTLVIPDTVEYIGDFAFYLGSGHTVNNIVIPSSVKTIKNRGISNQNRPGQTLNCYCQNNAYATSWVNTNKGSLYLTLMTTGFKGISYILNGGKNNSSNPISYSDEETITLYAPSKDGYSFEKWSAASGDLVFTAGSEGTPDTWTYTIDAAKTGDYDANGNLVFTASWTAGTYTIKYDAVTNGGALPAGAEATFEKEYRSVFSQAEYVTASKDNAMFIGWFTDPKAGKKIEFGTSVFDLDFSLYKDDAFTLYAHYQATTGLTGSLNTIVWTFDPATGELSFYCPYDPDTDQEAIGNYFTIPNFTVKKPAPWHDLADKITSIDLGNVTSIGQYAFMDCAITAISFPSNIDVVYSYAFYNCSKLENVEICYTKTYTQGSYIFLGCNLKKVTVGGDNTTIPDLFVGSTFAPNTVLTIPKEVTIIKSSAFAYRSDYEGARPIVGISFEANSRLKSIGCCAFEGCPITELDLPDSLEEIQDWAFRYTLISEVTIPEGTNKLGVRCFAVCPNLVQVTVPASVEYMGYMYENNWGQVIEDSEVFTNFGWTNGRQEIKSKGPITFIASKGSAAYEYAKTYASEYNYKLQELANYVVLFSTGESDNARKGATDGLLNIGGNALMGLNAADIAASTDLSPVRKADPGFNEATMTSRIGFVQAMKSGDLLALTGDEFIKPGFTLTGWKNEATGKVLKNNASYENLAADGESVVLTAQWKQDKYTVKYNLNGGSYVKGAAKGIASYSVSFDQNTGKYGFAKTYLPNCADGDYVPLDQRTVTRKGYKFKGWFDNKDFGGLRYYYVGGDVLQSLTLYAKWEPELYAAKFDANGGDFSANPGAIEGIIYSDTKNSTEKSRNYLSFKYNTTYQLVATTFEKEGYVLDSWNTQADGKGKKYAKTAKIKNLLPTGTSAEIVLYAQWKPRTYNISYELKGGKLASAPKKYTAGKKITLKVPSKAGFKPESDNVFVIAYIDGESATAINAVNVIKGTDKKGNEIVKGYEIDTAGWDHYGNLELSVPWEINDEYKAITYDVIVHDNYTANVHEIKNFNNSTTEPDGSFVIPERTGYEFIGLNTAKNGKGYYLTPETEGGVHKFYYNDLTTRANSTVHVYAIWRAREYSVAYSYKNISRTGTPAVASVTNKNVTAVTFGRNYKLIKPSVTGYTFTGWTGTGAGLARDKNGFVTKITSANAADIDLTGSFTENRYFLSITSNGGVSKATGKSATISLNGGNTYLYNDDVAEDLSAYLDSFKRKGYVFRGFALDSKGKNLLMDEYGNLNPFIGYYREKGAFGDSDAAITGLSSKNKAKVKVYALWEKVATGKPVISEITTDDDSLYYVCYSASPEPSGTVYEVQMSKNILFRTGTVETKYYTNDVAEFTITAPGKYYFRVRQTVTDSFGNKTTGRWSKITSITKE